MITIRLFLSNKTWYLRVKLELERSNLFKQGHIYEHSHKLYQSQQTEMLEMLINQWMENEVYPYNGKLHSNKKKWSWCM